MGTTNIQLDGGHTGQENVIYFQVKHSLSSKKLVGNLIYVSDKQTGKLD